MYHYIKPVYVFNCFCDCFYASANIESGILIKVQSAYLNDCFKNSFIITGFCFIEIRIL